MKNYARGRGFPETISFLLKNNDKNEVRKIFLTEMVWFSVAGMGKPPPPAQFFTKRYAQMHYIPIRIPGLFKTSQNIKIDPITVEK